MDITINGDPIDDKLLGLIEQASEALAVNRMAAGKAIADAQTALRRVIKRGMPLPAEYAPVSIARRNGRKINLHAALLLASHDWESRTGDMRIELWESIDGAWIAVTRSGDVTTATVVPPGDDQMAREDAVMAQFDWHERAKSMVRKLGWSLALDVD